MNAIRSRFNQRGIVAVWIVIFLIAAVTLVLTQTLGNTGANSLGNAQQMDSVAAFFAAESGLQRGRGIVAAANPITSTVCSTAGVGAGPHELVVGKSSFTLSAVVAPGGCDGVVTPCTGCTITSTGTVGGASRTVSRTLSLTAVNGSSCNADTVPATNCSNQSATPDSLGPPVTWSVPPTWSLNLKNTTPNTAYALFSLAFRRLGNPTSATCTSPGCTSQTVEWAINAQNGTNSVGGMGNSVVIAAGDSKSIFQVLSLTDRNVAIVGALFPGTGTPIALGSYWDEVSVGSAPTGADTPQTTGKTGNDHSGETNNGATTSNLQSCIGNEVSPTTPTPGTKQTCTSWCYGGDMLVMGFSGGSSTGLTDELLPDAVLFNTAGTPSQSIVMNRVAKFPNASVTGAPTNVYSEIWYAKNPQFDYGAVATGSIATETPAVSFNAYTTTGSTTLEVRTSGGGPSGTVRVDAIVTGLGIPTDTRILSQTSGTPGGVGFYVLSNAATATVSTGTGAPMTSARSVLTVTAIASGTLAVKNTLFSSGGGTNVTAGTTIVALGTTSGPFPWTYYLNKLQTVASRTINAGASSSGNIINVGNATPPSAGTIVTVRSGSGTGGFAKPATEATVSNPQLDATTGNTFEVSTSPTTLVGAHICGGTCAFFDHQNAKTRFEIGDSTAPNTDYWTAGFVCLSGADLTPQAVTSSSVRATKWNEVVK